MTEVEAKTKWCPFARTVEKWPEGNTSARNRFVNGPTLQLKAENLAGCQCIGSACMAWRWESEIETDHDDRGYVSGTYKATSEEHGYCGLAGKP